MKDLSNAQPSDNPAVSCPEGPPVNAQSPLLGRQPWDTQPGVTKPKPNRPEAPLSAYPIQPDESKVNSTSSIWAELQDGDMPPERDVSRTQSISKGTENVSTTSITGPFSHTRDCVNDGRDDDTCHRTTRGYWRTIWLCRRTLALLAILFASLAGLLIVVWRVNVSHNGFRTTLSSNHYSWTYGPTAILIVVLSFWRQVDFYCKLLQPWRTMSLGLQSADRTVLLDYVSPLNAMSFVRAMRFRHGHVASSITGFVILKLIILFSTGLLVLSPTAVPSIRPITAEIFDPATFRNTSLNDSLVPPGMWSWRAYSNISAGPVYEYLKILEANSSSNDIEADQYVVPSLESGISSGVRSILAQLDVFSPEIVCERADAVLRPLREDEPPGGAPNVQLDSATCSVGGEWQSDLPIQVRPGKLQCTEECETWTSYNFFRVNCSDIADPEHYDNVTLVDGEDPDGISLDVDTPYDLRFALIVTNLTFDRSGPFKIQEAVQHQTAATICKVDYSMNVATVLRDLADNSVTVQDLSPAGQLSGLSGMMFGEAMHSALYSSQSLDLGDGIDQLTNPSATSPFYRLLLQSLPQPQTMDQLLSVDVLQRSALSVWEGLSAQFVRDNLLKPSDRTMFGTVVIVEERLHVETRSLWIMVIGFSLATMLALGMMMTVTPRLVPQDPGLITTSALVLRASPDLQKLLNGCSGMRSSQLERELRNFSFGTSAENNEFRISASQNNLPQKETAGLKTKTGTWAPLIAKYPILGLTLTLPLATIVVLEVLHAISERDHGFVDVSGSENTATYLSRYISALTALLIATCFNMLDFTTASFAPYSRLRQGSAPASQSLSFSVLGKLPPVALFHSIVNRQFASAFSNLAGTMGSILTVIVSGLFVVNRAVAIETPVLASLSDRWDVNWSNSAKSGDSGAALLLDQFQHGGATLPSTIWNDTVILSISNLRSPSDGTPMTDDTGAGTGRNYTFVVDSLRPLLSCRVVPDDEFEITTTQQKARTGGAGPLLEYNSTYVSAFPPLPEGCQHGGQFGVETYYNFSSRIHASDRPDEDTAWVGSLDDLHLGPWTSALKAPDGNAVQEYGENRANIDHLSDNPAGCPSIGVTFAKLSTHVGKTSKDDVTVLVCSQRLQEVKVKLTYHDDENGALTLHPDIAPAVLEGSTRFLTNGTEGVVDFPYRVQAHLHGSYPNLTTFDTTVLQGSRGMVPLDLFMNHLVYGPNGTAEEALTGKANRATLVEAVQEMYAKYMRFVIDMHFRIPIPQEARAAVPGDEGLLEGVTYTNTSRLQVNFASKLALQIILGVMTLLGACAFLMSDLRGVIPRAPYSIASTMAFVAVSDLCDERKPLLSEDAQWMCRKELNKLFAGWSFSLGWWSGPLKSERSCVEHARSREREASECCQATGEKIFGINVGVPDDLGFRETTSWAIRRRLTEPA